MREITSVVIDRFPAFVSALSCERLPLKHIEGIIEKIRISGGISSVESLVKDSIIENKLCISEGIACRDTTDIKAYCSLYAFGACMRNLNLEPGQVYVVPEILNNLDKESTIRNLLPYV